MAALLMLGGCGNGGQATSKSEPPPAWCPDKPWRGDLNQLSASEQARVLTIVQMAVKAARGWSSANYQVCLNGREGPVVDLYIYYLVERRNAPALGAGGYGDFQMTVDLATGEARPGGAYQ
jgi:hypothetical protein